MIDHSKVSAEFRELPIFKSLLPNKRKAIVNCLKQDIFDVSEPKISNDKFYFKSDKLRELYKSPLCGTIQNEDIASFLNKISQYHYTIQWYTENSFGLYRFSMIPSKRAPEFVYHKSDTPPNIILKEGIKPAYSFGIKAFPSLIFVGTEPCWFGDYTYKIRVNQPIFIDTNMDWQARDKQLYLCVKNAITPDFIEFVE